MAKVVLYIATSLDGYIAKPDGNLDWLTSIPNPPSGDYGYADLLQRIGTIIMGRKTYDALLGFGLDWYYTDFDSYIFTTQKDFRIHSPRTYTVSENIRDFVLEKKRSADKDIWLIGGSELVTMFINDDLLDTMIISIIPKIIGEGIPLFAGKPKETEWKLTGVHAFETGLVNLTYEKIG